MSLPDSMPVVLGAVMFASTTFADQPTTIGSLLRDGYEFVPFASGGGMSFALSKGDKTFVCLKNEYPVNQQRLVWYEDVREGRVPDASAPPIKTACVEVH